jgi:diketogulonate reductase-like aldo/keto reductase
VTARSGASNATLAQLSIAWPIAQGSRAGAVIIPIPGAKSRKHLEENVRAADIVLTADDLAEIDRIVPPGAASGTLCSRRTISRKSTALYRPVPRLGLAIRQNKCTD